MGQVLWLRLQGFVWSDAQSANEGLWGVTLIDLEGPITGHGNIEAISLVVTSRRFGA